MKNKLLIFVVFASVAQNSFVLSLNKSTSEFLADIDQIQSDQEEEQRQIRAGVSDLFDGIIRLAARNYYARDNVRQNFTISNITIERFRRSKQLPYRSLNLVAEQPDDVVKRYTDLAAGFVDLALAGFNSALALANVGEFSKYPSHVEDLETSLILGFQYPTHAMFAFLRSSMQPDEETDAIIDTVRNETMVLLDQIAGTCMNAMKMYDDAVAGGTHNVGVALLNEIEYQKSRALALQERYGNHLFTAMTAMYTHRHLRSGGSVFGLYQRRYALSASLSNCDEVFAAFSDMLNHKLNDYRIGLRDVGENDSLSIDATKNVFRRTWRDNINIYTEIIRAIGMANSRSDVGRRRDGIMANALLYGNIIFDEVIMGFTFNSNYSTFQQRTNVAERKLPHQKIIGPTFDMIRDSNPNIQGEPLSRINDFESKAMGHLKKISTYIINAVRNVAKVFYGMDAEPLTNFRNNTTAKCRAYVRSIFAGIEISSMQAKG